MSADKNHSEQFEKYLKGQMSPEEAHAFERVVLDDPFAQEALEGLESVGNESLQDIEKLKARVATKKKRSIPFMRLAAVAALLITASYSLYYFTEQIGTEQLAMEEDVSEKPTQSGPAPDTIELPNKLDEQLAEESDIELIIPETTENIEPVLEEVTEEHFITEAEIVEVDEVADEEAIELVAEADAAEDFFSENIIQEDLERRSAGIQVSQIARPNPMLMIDSNALEEIVVTPQPLVAQTRSLKADDSDQIEKDKKAESRFASRSAVSARTITGRITDDTGEPLPGVNVIIKGTTTGVTSDLDGNYRITLDDGRTLIFAYVGFSTTEIEVGSRETLDVTLGGVTELQEVVVTGYGSRNEDPVVNYKAARPGTGNRAFKKYLEDNLVYPEAAKTNEVEGTVVLELTIDSSGQVSEIDIKKSLGYGCDEEAIRLVKDGPSWEAAERNGSRVSDKLKVRVKFKLD